MPYKLWYEVDGEHVTFSVQNDYGEPIVKFGKTYKSVAIKYLQKEKRKMLKQIPTAFDNMIKYVKEGVLNE